MFKTCDSTERKNLPFLSTLKHWDTKHAIRYKQTLSLEPKS